MKRMHCRRTHMPLRAYLTRRIVAQSFAGRSLRVDAGTPKHQRASSKSTRSGK